MGPSQPAPTARRCGAPQANESFDRFERPRCHLRGGMVRGFRHDVREMILSYIISRVHRSLLLPRADVVDPGEVRDGIDFIARAAIMGVFDQ